MLAAAVLGCAAAAAVGLVSANSLRTLAAFSTDMSARSIEQRHNITRAAAAVDGIVLRPGAEFSFNRAVGVCGAARGYRLAPAIVDGELRSEWGGGVCQVSSTLYNAALLAGLPITERHAHSRPVSSVPPGRDAASAFGIADLRFVNDSGSLMKIAASVRGNRLTISILGRLAAPREVDVYTRTQGRSASRARGLIAGGHYVLDACAHDETVLTYRVIREGRRPAVRELVSSDVYASPRPLPGQHTR